MNFDKLAEPILEELDKRQMSPEDLAVITQIDLEYINDVLFNGSLISDILMESLEQIGIGTVEHWIRHQHSFLENGRMTYTKQHKAIWLDRISRMKFDESKCSEEVATIFGLEKKNTPRWREYMFQQRSEFSAYQHVMQQIPSIEGLTQMHYDAMILLARTDLFEDYAGWHIPALLEQLDAICLYRAQFARYVMIREAIIH